MQRKATVSSSMDSPALSQKLARAVRQHGMQTESPLGQTQSKKEIALRTSISASGCGSGRKPQPKATSSARTISSSLRSVLGTGKASPSMRAVGAVWTSPATKSPQKSAWMLRLSQHSGARSATHTPRATKDKRCSVCLAEWTPQNRCDCVCHVEIDGESTPYPEAPTAWNRCGCGGLGCVCGWSTDAVLLAGSLSSRLTTLSRRAAASMNLMAHSMEHGALGSDSKAERPFRTGPCRNLVAEFAGTKGMRTRKAAMICDLQALGKHVDVRNFAAFRCRSMRTVDCVDSGR